MVHTIIFPKILRVLGTISLYVVEAHSANEQLHPPPTNGLLNFDKRNLRALLKPQHQNSGGTAVATTAALPDKVVRGIDLVLARHSFLPQTGRLVGFFFQRGVR